MDHHRSEWNGRDCVLLSSVERHDKELRADARRSADAHSH